MKLKILKSQKDLCYDVYARELGGDYYCGLISEESLYSYTCYSHFAIEKNNVVYCESIEDLNNKWKCMRDYALGTGNSSGCDEISDFATYSKQGCYVNYAKTYNNPEVCTRIEDASARGGCFSACESVREKR